MPGARSVHADLLTPGWQLWHPFIGFATPLITGVPSITQAVPHGPPESVVHPASTVPEPDPLPEPLPLAEPDPLPEPELLPQPEPLLRLESVLPPSCAVPHTQTPNRAPSEAQT